MTDPGRIRFDCPACGHSIKVAAKHSGRKAKCPSCGKPLVVPTPDEDGLELDEPIGYALAEDEPEPEPTQHQPHVTEAVDASIHTSSTGRNESPSFFKLIGADMWGIIALTGLALVWLICILNFGFGIDLLSAMSDSEYDTPNDVVTPKGSFIFALVFTLVLAPLAAYRYWRTWLMMTRGVRIPCTIIKEGRFSKSGMSDVTFQYSYGGKTYTPKMSVHHEKIDTISHLLIDPNKPKRCMIE